jgi:hypothetical protein
MMRRRGRATTSANRRMTDLAGIDREGVSLRTIGD